MGEHRGVKFPQEVLDRFSSLGVDLPSYFSAGHLGTRMGIEVVEASPEKVVGTMPVEGNTQPYGLLHGGASAVLAETLGSVGAMLHGGPEKIAVGVDLNCSRRGPPQHRGRGPPLAFPHTRTPHPTNPPRPPPPPRGGPRPNTGDGPRRSHSRTRAPPTGQPPRGTRPRRPVARPFPARRPSRCVTHTQYGPHTPFTHQNDPHHPHGHQGTDVRQHQNPLKLLTYAGSSQHVERAPPLPRLNPLLA